MCEHSKDAIDNTWQIKNNNKYFIQIELRANPLQNKRLYKIS